MSKWSFRANQHHLQQKTEKDMMVRMVEGCSSYTSKARR